jgi:CRP-like cAMP-binding protein
VELAERLRHLPLFASVSVDELFRVAGASRQVRHEPGATLLQDGSVPDTIHILLDGRVSCSGRDGMQSTLDPPAAIGFAEALAGAAMRDTFRATERVVTLALNSEELRTLLADNADLVSGLFATLASSADAEKRPVHATRAGAELEALAASGLGAVEKILALQRIPLFTRVSAEEMRQLATITRTVNITAGTPLFTASGPSSLWLILSGEVALREGPGDPAYVARAGDMIGAYAALAGKELGLAGDVQRSGIALQIKGDDLFLVLGERPEMLRQFFSGLFTAVRAQRQQALQVV